MKRVLHQTSIVRDIGSEHPVQVLGKHGVIPDRILDANAHETAEQRRKLHAFHQLALQADRAMRLQQQRGFCALDRSKTHTPKLVLAP